jgi:hypothetical protein
MISIHGSGRGPLELLPVLIFLNTTAGERAMEDTHEKVFIPFVLSDLQQEIETLQALRASLESIKQIIQGVHNDLQVVQHNYTELAGVGLTNDY